MRKFLLLAAGVMLALPAAANAQRIETKERAEGNANIFGIGIESLNAGLGYSNFTGDAADDLTGGVAWGVRLDLDVTQPVNLEINYTGGINSFTPDDINNFNLYTNQVQAAAQVQPWMIGQVAPYVSGGIGLTRFSVARDPDLNIQYQSDTAGSVPLAAGAQWHVAENWLVGARAQWDILFDNEIETQTQTTQSDRWGILLNVGARNF